MLDTHVGISSFVSTGAREGHVLVASFVYNETADWKYKNGGRRCQCFESRVSNKFLTLTLVSLLPEAPETKVYIPSFVRTFHRFLVGKGGSRLYVTIIHSIQNGNENIFQIIRIINFRGQSNSSNFKSRLERNSILE